MGAEAASQAEASVSAVQKRLAEALPLQVGVPNRRHLPSSPDTRPAPESSGKPDEQSERSWPASLASSTPRAGIDVVFGSRRCRKSRSSLRGDQLGSDVRRPGPDSDCPPLS